MLTTILWVIVGSIAAAALLLGVVQVLDMFFGIDDDHN